jgi:hypothetical protein
MAIFGDIAEIQCLAHTDLGQTISNTYHVSRPSGSAPDLATLQGLADDWVTYFSATYRATLATQFVWDSIIARQVVDPTSVDIRLEATHITNLAGTRGSVTHGVPASICALVSMKSPIASRRARAHVFMAPAYNAADLNGDNFLGAASYLTNIDAYVAKLATGCSPVPTWTGSTLSGWYLAQYSRAAALQSLAHAYACTAVVRSAKVRWLRSRERGTS